MVKDKKAAALEWAIVFCLVIFAIITLLLSAFLASYSSTKKTEKLLKEDTDLNQIGEYFVRYVGYSSDALSGSSNTSFPTGKETSTDNFNKKTFNIWMDNTSKQFFIHCNEDYGYTYTATREEKSSVTIKNGYRTVGYIHSLTVKNKKDEIELYITIKEGYVNYDEKNGIFLSSLIYSNNPQSEFEVLEWTLRPTGVEKDLEQGAEGTIDKILDFFGLQGVVKWVHGFISDIKIPSTTYTVTFKSDTSTTTQVIEKNSEIELPTETDGHICPGSYLIGWSDGTKTVKLGQKYQVTSSVILTAEFMPYTVTFKYNYENSPNSGTYETKFGVISSDKIPKDLTREHYNFEGWFTEEKGGAKIESEFIPTCNCCLYAHWSKKAQIQFVLNYLEGDADNYKLFESNVNELPKNPEREHYIFKGWHTDPTAESSITLPFCPEGNVTIYAHWSKKAQTLFLLNYPGKENEQYAQIEGDVTATNLAADPIREHYDFIGWYTAAEGGEQITLPYKPVDDTNTTFYAHWKEKAKYTITYKKGSATSGSLTMSSQTKYKGEDLILAGENEDAPLTYTKTYTTTVTVSFDSNGGGTAPTEIVKDKITTKKYTHSGWTATDKTVYAFGSVYSADVKTTMTAKYTSSSSSSDTVTLPKAPTAPTGKRFSGWYTAASGGKKRGDAEQEVKMLTLTSSTDATITVKLYAQWADATYSVKFNASDITNGTASSSNVSSVPYGSTIAIDKTTGKVTINKPDGTTMKTVTITPNDGYYIDSITANSTKVTKTITISAVCKAYITVNISCGAGGSISPTKTSYEITEGTDVTVDNANKKITIGSDTISVSPNNHYEIDSMTKSEGNGTIEVNVSFKLKKYQISITYSNSSITNNTALSFQLTNNDSYSVSDNVLTINGKTYTVTANTGYDFSGFYSENEPLYSGKIEGDMTITAKCTVKSFNLTIEDDNTTTTVKKAVGDTVLKQGEGTISVEYGTIIAFSYTCGNYDKDGSEVKNTTVYKSLSGLNAGNSNDVTTSFSKNTTYYFSMPAENVTISSEAWDNACVTGDTLVTMADGSKKNIKDIAQNDVILSYDFYKKTFAEDVVSAVWNHGDDEYYVILLNFSNGSTVEVVNQHSFFDITQNQFVTINSVNYVKYIGHEFLGGGENIVLLESAFCERKYSSCWSLLSKNNGNFIANGVLSLTPDPFENYFELLNELLSDSEMLEKDIETYGLYEYSDWEEYISYEDFVAFKAQYFKIFVGKGILTEADIMTLIDLYAKK